jgi:hypothetical protein
VRLDRRPIGIDNSTKKGGEHDDDGESNRQVTNEIPAMLKQSVGDDRQSEAEHAEEGNTPESRRPSQQRDQRPSDRLVLRGCLLGNHGTQAQDERSDRKEHAVDRSTIPPAGLGGSEQREMPRVLSRPRTYTSIGDRSCHRDSFPDTRP